MNITKYSFGGNHVCIVIDEKVQCVGSGDLYQLGNAKRLSSKKFVFAHVWDDYTIDAIHCIRDKTYVISNGNVYYVGQTWGTSEGGWSQLKSHPFQIQELENIVEIKGGMNLVCALDQEGALFCWWGDLPSYDAENDQLYNGFSDTPRLIAGLPIDEDEKKRVLHFAVADETVCYYMSDQTITCSGNNDADQLGGLVSPMHIGEVKNLVAGRYHFCALLEGGRVYCWGGAGDRFDNIDSTMPTPTLVIDNIQDVTASFNTTFARKYDGTLYGWGRNSLYQIGYFPDKPRPYYHSIPILAASSDSIPNADVLSYQLTYTTAHAILKDGRIASWGSNINGMLGDEMSNDWALLPDVVFMDIAHSSSSPSSRPTLSRNSNTPTTSPLPSSRPSVSRKSSTPTTSNTGISTYSFGRSHICVLVEAKMRCVDAILCTDSKTCVISEGKVYCIGENVVKRIRGSGSITWGVETFSTPFLIREIDDIVKIDGGDDIVCGLQKGGALFCWGILPYKYSNGVFDRLTDDPPEKIEINVTHFAVSDDAICSYLENKGTQCFGKNKYGELGGLLDPTFIGEVSKLVAGAHHFCALLSNGNVLCWGTMNDNSKIATPTLIMTDAVDISTSSSIFMNADFSTSITSTSFAQKKDGTLYGWGDNTYYQLGTCDTAFRETPAPVNQVEISNEDVESYHLTDRTSHAILKDGRIAAWGQNRYSTLGDGKSSQYTTVVSPPTFMNLFYQDTPLPTGIPVRCPTTDRPSFRPSFAPSKSTIPPITMHPTKESMLTFPTIRPTYTNKTEMSALTTIVVPSLVVVVAVVVGCAVYFQRRNRGRRNDPYRNDINPTRTEPDDIPAAFNITPITPAIAVPATDTAHITAKIFETNESITSNIIPSALALSNHPIPSAPPMESVDNTRTQ